MEAFSLLKYWKTTTSTSTSTSTSTTAPTTIVTDVSDHDSDAAGGGVDDGPFFDLEFAIPADDDEIEENGECKDEEGEEEEEEEEEEEVEVEETNVTFSPSDDLFIKGRILQIDGNGDDETIIHSATKSTQFTVPISLAKSATKFRVFLHGLKRSKSESNPRKSQPQQNHKKSFTVKFNVDDVPIFSLLTRASSNSKSNSTTTSTETTVTTTAENDGKESGGGGGGGGEEKRNKKEVVQKYLKMVKPLYVKVSKRKESKKATEMKDKMVGPGLNLKVIVKKHLGKSKSAVVHSMLQQNNNNNSNNNNKNNINNNGNTTSSKKRDDSLLQQQDGIQSAILHCKRSFNSSKDFLEEEETSSVLLTQLVNESLNEKKSKIVEEGKGNDDVTEKMKM